MVLPAQFQLGLELTNIVNPISHAVSAVGSLALVDAIRKSGSDTITEMKLASFLGRNIIDPAMELHFREAVSKSDQSVISRYMDIILESGSGPTVQEAIKNPALFSMVIQLSGLAFAHEDEPLAGAIVEAMERIVRDSGADVAIVPDYVGLLGTLRACQQQTAAFRWASVYEAVEHKIQQTLTASANGGSQPERRATRENLGPGPILGIMGPPGVSARCLPFPVLQALLMWLNSLQKFPEHRLLHLRCDTGISTIVVWCYHMLGLSVKVDLSGTNICFGKDPSNILIEKAGPKDVGASLMDPADQHEPLFTLAIADTDPEIGYEDRAEAYGFGSSVLKAAGLSEWQEGYCSQWIIVHCIERLKDEKSLDKYICEEGVIRAGKFLFGLKTVDVEALPKRNHDSCINRGKWSRIDWRKLAAILITFAKIQEQDLERCKSMPLSLSAYHSSRSHMHVSCSIPNSSTAFEELAYLLLGHMFSTEYVANAALISAWGWSIFLDTMDAADPSEVSNTIRVMRGVPSRRGVRRARIVDGPTDMKLWAETVYQHPQIRFPCGASTAERGVTMVGHHSDAFQITQIITWAPRHKTMRKTQKLGFRNMQDLVETKEWLPPCECAPSRSDIVKQLDAYGGDTYYVVGQAKNKLLFYPRPLQPSDQPGSSSERLMARKVLINPGGAVNPDVYFFYVSGNAAARWLGLQSLYTASQDDHSAVIIRGFDTCLDCAMAYQHSESKHPLRILL